jgi:hypothetical protein
VARVLQRVSNAIEIAKRPSGGHMKFKHLWAPAALCTIALTCATAFGQAAQNPATGQVRQLSEKSQQAIARLHALNEARQAYARAAADVTDDEQVKQFLRERATEYEKGDQRLSAFAQMYGVDINSSKMQEMTKKTQQTWAKENQKIMKAHGLEANKQALSTFIDRNDEAVDDLRTLRGEVQEEQLRALINDRIAALEEESTRAQQLRRQVTQEEQMKKDQKMNK